MGSGSSRRKRSCSPAADRPGRRGRSSSAPSGQGEEARGSQAPAPTELPSTSLRRPQPGEPAEDSDWELLEEVLAECEEPGALPPTARGPAAPIPGPPRRGPAGDSGAGHDRHPGAAAAGSGRGSGAAGGDQPASLTRSTQDPENNNNSASDQELFITLEPIPPEPTQGRLPDPPGGEGTSAANVSTLPLSSSSQRLAKIRRFPVRSNKKPEMQSPISYDYAEEELMASIEQEYCR
nr:cystin-1 isoform X4 [Caretta caretta]